MEKVSVESNKLPNGEPIQQTTKKSDTGLASILGDIAYLMMHSEKHRHLFISDMEWLVMPALRLKQMRIFRNAKRPLVYISWARLTQEAEKRLLAGNPRLAPGDWNAGSKFWIVDIVNNTPSIYPFLKSLHNQVFKGQEAHLVVPKKHGRGFEGVLLTEVLKEMEKNQTRASKH